MDGWMDGVRALVWTHCGWGPKRVEVMVQYCRGRGQTINRLVEQNDEGCCHQSTRPQTIRTTPIKARHGNKIRVEMANLAKI